MDSLNIERLIGSVVQGALGGRRKRSRGAARFLTGGHSSFLNASTLLTLAGVAWGVFETATQSSGSSPAGPTPSAPPIPQGAPGSSGARPLSTPPPLPGTASASSPLTPPPLPYVGSGPAGPSAPAEPATAPDLPAPAARDTAGPALVSPSAGGGASVPAEVLRVIRLTLSAARADGVLGPHEREAILAQARLIGAEPIIAPELDAPQPLAAIVSGVADPRVRHDLYTLAYSIIRADEQVQPGERQYLVDLAGQLGLDANTTEQLEEQAASRISAASREA